METMLNVNGVQVPVNVDIDTESYRETYESDGANKFIRRVVRLSILDYLCDVNKRDMCVEDVPDKYLEEAIEDFMSANTHTDVAELLGNDYKRYEKIIEELCENHFPKEEPKYYRIEFEVSGTVPILVKARSEDDAVSFAEDLSLEEVHEYYTDIVDCLSSHGYTTVDEYDDEPSAYRYGCKSIYDTTDD